MCGYFACLQCPQRPKRAVEELELRSEGPACFESFSSSQDKEIDTEPSTVCSGIGEGCAVCGIGTFYLAWTQGQGSEYLS